MAQAQDIQLIDVTRGKGDGAQNTLVLRGLSLTLPAGQSVGLIGRSGGGKTTFLRLLNRLEDPDAGRILYGGVDTRTLEPTALRRRIVLVNQRSVMFPGTVLDNIMLPDTITETGPGDSDRARRALEQARLDPALAERDAAALSVGQQGRVQLARSLYLEPEVLMLDESTANLDPRVAGQILHDLHAAAANAGMTLIHVSHEPDKLRRCDRLLLIDNGRLALDDRPAAVLDNPTGIAADVLATGD